MNNIRNRLSHKLGTPIIFDEVFKLAGLAAAAGGIDFSDSAIYLDKSRYFHEYGIEGVIQEVFENTAQYLLYLRDDESFLENFVSVRNS
ncbi:glycyl-tRNA synthetase subunit alpha [Vibrio pomeroyi]|uniref:glycyl-tRNA synthetase subunit alpha n=1 Tax=Vibrio pomeroyi TaxID=198832 RepID=UPI0021C342BB|nr:glycyl-tRNA synthetase subunit alpha [Vibrio pomeroyi]